MVWWCQTFSFFFFFWERSRLLQLSATLLYDVSRATGIFVESHHPAVPALRRLLLVAPFPSALADCRSSVATAPFLKSQQWSYGYDSLRAQVNDFSWWIFARLMVRKASAFCSVRLLRRQGTLAKNIPCNSLELCWEWHELHCSGKMELSCLGFLSVEQERWRERQWEEKAHSLGGAQGDAVIASLFLKHFLVNSDHFIIPCKPCGSW